MNTMENEWLPTKIELDTLDWRGNPIHLKDVPAIMNAKTGKVRLYPAQVSLAEYEALAKKYDLKPRDIATLLTLYVKPGVFKEGSLPTRYHVNKTLFYIWKELGKKGLGEVFPHDNFVAFPRGPVPEHLESDQDRLGSKGLVSSSFQPWGPNPKDQSVLIELTPSGMQVATALLSAVADPFKETILRIKERIFPLDPKTIRERVHRDYPEYKKTYTELDTD